jgi:hypothetical protein
MLDGDYLLEEARRLGADYFGSEETRRLAVSNVLPENTSILTIVFTTADPRYDSSLGQSLAPYSCVVNPDGCTETVDSTEPNGYVHAGNTLSIIQVTLFGDTYAVSEADVRLVMVDNSMPRSALDTGGCLSTDYRLLSGHVTNEWATEDRGVEVQIITPSNPNTMSSRSEVTFFARRSIQNMLFR